MSNSLSRCLAVVKTPLLEDDDMGIWERESSKKGPSGCDGNQSNLKNAAAYQRPLPKRIKFKKERVAEAQQAVAQQKQATRNAVVGIVMAIIFAVLCFGLVIWGATRLH